MKPEIRGLLFDKDGTLFDFQDTWGRWAATEMMQLARGDSAHAQRLADAIGLDLKAAAFHPDSFVIAGTADEIVEALLPHLPAFTRESLTAHLDVASASAQQAEVTPLIPLFEGLKAAGLKLGISTNDAESAARANLASCNVETMFDFIAGYDSGFGSKPAPGMQHAFCSAMGLAPQEVAMVGDSTHDLFAAKAAGMFRIGVLTGVAGESDLAPHADQVLPDIGHLPEFLGLGQSQS